MARIWECPIELYLGWPDFENATVDVEKGKKKKSCVKEHVHVGWFSYNG